MTTAPEVPAGSSGRDPGSHAQTPPPRVPSVPDVPVARWPLLLLALPAVVAIWSGWVGLGGMAGFGPVTLLPGISDYRINTAITLPIGMEVYAAYALRAWLAAGVPARARVFARRSALGALGLGAAGQVAFHLMTAAHWKTAPWPVTVAVSCVPVAVLGMGAALAHLLSEPAGEPAAPSVSPELLEREPDAPTFVGAGPDREPPVSPPREPVSPGGEPDEPAHEPVVSRDPSDEPSGEPTPLRVSCDCPCGAEVSVATRKRHRKALRDGAVRAQSNGHAEPVGVR